MSDEEKVISLAGGRKKDKKTSEKQEKKQEPTSDTTYCSFCGRPNQMVIKMIKGPGVNICSECVMICVQYFILEDKIASSDVQKILDTFWHGAKK